MCAKLIVASYFIEMHTICDQVPLPMSLPIPMPATFVYEAGKVENGGQSSIYYEEDGSLSISSIEKPIESKILKNNSTPLKIIPHR